MEVIRAKGHPNVSAKHATTIEITRDREMGKRADCIIGVAADKGLSQLSKEFKLAAKNPETQIEVVLSVGGFHEVVRGWGHEDLTFEDDDDLVIRKSNFTCPRTLMIRSDKASRDLDRRLIELLKEENSELVVEIRIREPGIIFPEI
jgi:hypothetical protein